MRNHKKLLGEVIQRPFKNVFNYLFESSKGLFARKPNEYNEKQFKHKKFNAMKLAKIGQWELELETRKLHLSPEHIEMMGYHQSEIPQQITLSDYMERYVFEEDWDIIEEKFKELVHSNNVDHSGHLEYRLIRKDNSIGQVFVMVCGDKFIRNRITGISQDITYQRNIETQLRATLRQLADLKFALDESTLVTITDANGTIIYVNDTFCEISGYARKELVGSNHGKTKSGYHSKEFFGKMWSSISSGNIWRGEIKNKDKIGLYYWVDTTIVPFLNEQGHPYQYVAIRTDITKRKNAELKITHMAYHDSLTGLANRRLLMEQLTKMLENQSDLNMTAVLLFDLDNFKIINDNLGHNTGDEFLVMVANRLWRVVHPDETLARFGGDEFVLAIPNIGSQESLELRCLELLELMKEPFLIHNIEFFVTMSIGAACSPLNGNNAEELVSNADLAMYTAKGNNGNCFRIFKPQMLHESLRKLEIETKLRNAIEYQQLVLNYQPKIHIKSGITEGVEALIRWQMPEGQLIYPGEFIPLVEENGMIGPIGDWVIRNACQQSRKWIDQGIPPVVMGINLSPSQFKQGNLVEQVVAVINEFQIDPKYLELEITEGLLMENPNEAAEKLKHLKEVGVQISMDDFGTEFSSLYYLSKFPIDIIKIDRLFIKDIEYNSKVRTIINSIVSLAHDLGLKVTAEGVETKNQLAFLKLISCDFAQGFYFARPKDAKTVTEYLLNDADLDWRRDLFKHSKADSNLVTHE